MVDAKPKLKDNPRGALDQHITALQSESKMARKQALQKINEEIFENKDNSDCDLTVVFPEIYQYVLKSFSDPAEACREVAASIISNFIDRLPLNDYYLTYILPVLVRRIGCPEIIEESEEIRLVLIGLVHKILEKYKVSQLLSPFINDFTSILTKTVTDPYPKVKLEACECIIMVTKNLQRDFHFQCESYVKPVITNFTHQHYRVRVAAVKAIGAIVLAGNGQCFEKAITPMAEKLFDENAQVRMQITQEVGNWMLNYRDRYSFWHRMIPLLLTSLSDVMEDIRNTAATLWNNVGLQYMEENEEDLKKKTDFLKDVPTHYPPDIKRPNLGCRTLVSYNIGKIVPAIWREMDGWQEDCRLRCSQLLCWLLLNAEEGCTQHTNTIIRTLHRGAGDDDPRVIAEIKRASELFGYFITPETWWPLLEAEMDSWSALLVLANILKGSKPELVKEKAMLEICKELSDPDRCRLRKPKYQTELLHVAESLLDLCKSDCEPVFEQLFIINYTVYAMPFDDKIAFMALSNLDKLRYHEKCGKSLTSLYEKHIRRILSDITSDALTWTLLTPDCCLLQAVLLHSGYAMGAQLHLLAPLLRECLATPKVDPEVKLKVFTVLSTALLRRKDNFQHAETDKLEAFLKIIVQEVILPNLVWSPGRTAEAIRTAAVACLCSALQGDIDDDKPTKEIGADGDNNDKDVNLFPTKESLQPFLDEMVPLLAGLVDDNSTLTRSHALRCICCLAVLANSRRCFTAEILHKLYFGKS
ncbi:dynein assembly factor 5, axonemal [Phthorimaea operculella]|nr:dynein assembly factor 5, axonemal [Phthorimaea operculella]